MSQFDASENPEALFEEGKRFYFSSRGMDPDPELALSYFYRSARLGYAPAQRLLGVCLLEGLVCRKDYEKARFWLGAAAEQRDPQAALYLAIVYAQGLGVTKRWDVSYSLLTRPEVKLLPEALELKRKMKAELINLYPELSETLDRAEKAIRAMLSPTQARFISPFWPYGGSRDDNLEFRALLDLNLGKKTQEESYLVIKNLLDEYYRESLKKVPLSANPKGKA
jgi:hypothetical protein